MILFGNGQARSDLQQYVLHLLPLVFMALLMRLWAIRSWKHISIQNGLLWRAVTLVYATGPIYMLAWLMAFFRLPLSYQPTPKKMSGGMNPLWLLPHGVLAAPLIVGLVEQPEWHEPISPVLWLFAFAQGLPILILIFVSLALTVYSTGRRNRSDQIDRA